jgi:putative transposase
VKGRKRQLLVDTLGLIWAAAVHPADQSDPAGSWPVLLAVREKLPRLRAICGDSTYRGSRLVIKAFGWTFQPVEKPRGQQGFQVLPKRWVVERTFAWLGKCRRLSKDYEALLESSVAWIWLAMSRLMLRRLAP